MLACTLATVLTATCATAQATPEAAAVNGSAIPFPDSVWAVRTDGGTGPGVQITWTAYQDESAANLYYEIGISQSPTGPFFRAGRTRGEYVSHENEFCPPENPTQSMMIDSYLELDPTSGVNRLVELETSKAYYFRFAVRREDQAAVYNRLLSVPYVTNGTAEAVSTLPELPAGTAFESLLPQEFWMEDLANDDGTGVAVLWEGPADEASNAACQGIVYEIFVRDGEEGDFYPTFPPRRVPHGTSPSSAMPQFFGIWSNPANRQAVVVKGLIKLDEETWRPTMVQVAPDSMYQATMVVHRGDTRARLNLTPGATAEQNLFKFNKMNNFVFALVYGAVVLTFITMARKNQQMYIRKIAGLDAVEEALGRATEMGKAVYFVHGLRPMGDVSTIAAVGILSKIGQRTAQYETTLKVMNYDPIVYAVSQEVVRESYLDAGRPDAFNEDNVMFVADKQFSYAVAVNGQLVRERPATVFLMGYFYAESLLFAETGGEIGAIQIAGTDAYTQLPFFITTCDYTLMGEELYAASAYLAREPKLLGSLKGQDMGKAFLIITLVVGTLLETIGVEWLSKLLMPL